jgi:DNA-binding winged helix-turn-helix (wHTH) protein/predicted ATPase
MRYAFDDFEVDLQLFELRRAGQRVHVEPKVFDLLVFLIEHSERVVTKRELLEAVWPGEHVVEAVLPTAVRRLRTALGQDSSADTPIATERGRGYRFAAAVQRLDVAAAEPKTPVPAAPGPASPLPQTSARPATSPSLEPRLSSPALFPRERGTDVVTLHDEEPLIGRATLVVELSRVLDRVTAEQLRPRMRLLSGPPGVGRTRVLSELIELAHARQLPAFSTRGRRGAPELWPWSSLVRQIVDALDDAGRAALPKPLRRELQLIAPALRSGDSLPPPPSQSRPPLVVADAVRSLLAIACPAHAALLVIDDLDELDPASLEVLRALAEEESQRPLLFGGAREPLDPNGPLSRLVQQLERGERVERMPLLPLSVEDTAAYLRAAHGAGVPEDIARHVHRLTAGLPAVLRACVRAWPAHALIARQAAQLLRLPPTAYESARAWLVPLPEDAASLLSVAAVLGERFELGLLRVVSGHDAERALGAVEQAVELGILVADESGPQRYRFALPYLRDALYDALRPVERRPLHRAAVDALEQRASSTGAPVDTLELAHHLWNALPSVPVSKVVEHNARAAELLGAQSRWNDATIHYGRAFEALAYDSPQDPRASAELLLSLALAQRHAGDAHGAQSSLEQALQLAGRVADGAELTARVRSALAPG